MVPQVAKTKELALPLSQMHPLERLCPPRHCPILGRPLVKIAARKLRVRSACCLPATKGSQHHEGLDLLSPLPGREGPGSSCEYSGSYLPSLSFHCLLQGV
ncbi:hypothetical protein GHT09_016874 [Marmota monax]|uniref:Uncharacterized protein n=1 Tax=Marmota monax TaxID=9995 RepID=A0A834UUM9_MARMO|nr:hypothetical protein GHT09_016874 [Marmota monax]